MTNIARGIVTRFIPITPTPHLITDAHTNVLAPATTHSMSAGGDQYRLHPKRCTAWSKRRHNGKI